MKPLVSFILPTFNRRHTLPRTIRSLVAQTFNDWEIVVVDDGSADDTHSLCKHYGSKLGDRFTYYRQDNAGSSAARNKAISLARGDWLSFADSDDVHMPEKLANQIDRLVASKCKFSFTGFFLFNDQRDILPSYSHIPLDFEGDIYPRIIETQFNFVMTPSVVVDRQLVLAVGGFDSEMSVCEDIDLWGRVCRLTGACAVRRPHIGVHVRSPSAFPYLEGMQGRYQLYRRAFSRDRTLLPLCLSSVSNLYQIFIGTASTRGDADISQILEHDFNLISMGADPFSVLEHTIGALKTLRSRPKPTSLPAVS